MIEENIFKEDIRLLGDDKEEFLESLEFFHDSSKQMYIEPESLCLCSVYRCTKDELWIVKTDLQMATFSNLYTQIMTGNKSDSAAYDFCRVPKKRYYSMGLTEDDVKKMAKVGMFFEYEGNTVILSKRFLYHLSNVMNIGVVEQGMNPIRELFLANQLFDMDPFYITVRKKQDVYKAFYASVTPNCSNDIIKICKVILEHMVDKGASIYSWEIAHEKTEICFYYPEYAVEGFDFGIIFRISDTGEHATSLCNVVIAESTVFLMRDAILSKRNFGSIDAEKLIREFESMTEGSLEEYRKNIISSEVMKRATLEEAFHLFGLSRRCGKIAAAQLKEIFFEELEKGDTGNKGMKPLLKLPVLSEEIDSKEYVRQHLIRKIEDFLESVIRSDK